jgi:hypothetical protein
MATSDQLRAELAAARTELADALKTAGAAWERAPPSGEGEAAWSPRQAAEHVIGGDIMYASAVCIACGYPGLERQQFSFESAEDALTGMQEASAIADGRLKYVTETDLEKTNQRGATVEQIMQASAAHFRDHAAQIRAASRS